VLTVWPKYGGNFHNAVNWNLKYKILIIWKCILGNISYDTVGKSSSIEKGMVYIYQYLVLNLSFFSSYDDWDKVAWDHVMWYGLKSKPDEVIGFFRFT
jgi:hypothetical protein